MTPGSICSIGFSGTITTPDEADGSALGGEGPVVTISVAPGIQEASHEELLHRAFHGRNARRSEAISPASESSRWGPPMRHLDQIDFVRVRNASWVLVELLRGSKAPVRELLPTVTGSGDRPAISFVTPLRSTTRKLPRTRSSRRSTSRSLC